LISIIKDKNIICTNTQYDENNHYLQKSKVMDLENTIGNTNCKWETEKHKSNTQATQKA
jgi:hypothetical protein